MNKYHAKSVVYNGIRFDSKKEAERYKELSLLQRSGYIRDLKRQVPFVLIDKNEKFSRCVYKADFVYKQNGQQVVEDVKGFITDVYKIKRKLMYDRYGIEIKEI